MRGYNTKAYKTIYMACRNPPFPHKGMLFPLPPVFTRWNQQQTIAYFSTGNPGRKLEDVLQLGGPDPYGGAEPGLSLTAKDKKKEGIPPPPPPPPPPPLGPPPPPPPFTLCGAARPPGAISSGT